MSRHHLKSPVYKMRWFVVSNRNITAPCSMAAMTFWDKPAASGRLGRAKPNGKPAHRAVVCGQESHAERQGGSAWLRQCNAVCLLKLQGLCSNFWPLLLQELKSGL